MNGRCVAIMIVFIMWLFSSIRAAATCFHSLPKLKDLSVFLLNYLLPNPIQDIYNIYSLPWSSPSVRDTCNPDLLVISCTVVQPMLVVKVLNVDRRCLGWVNGRQSLLFISFPYCLYFLTCFVIACITFEPRKELYFQFLENQVVAMCRKLSLEGSAELWALLLNLTAPQHLHPLRSVIFTSVWMRL